MSITYDIVELPEQRIGSVRGTLGQAQELWGQMMEIGGQSGLIGRPDVLNAAVLPSNALEVSPDDMMSMEYNAAFIVPADLALPAELTEGTIPAGRYARPTYTGPLDGLGGAWGEFSGGWLPSSGESLGTGVAFEIYRSPGEDGSEPATELHIPLA